MLCQVTDFTTIYKLLLILPPFDVITTRQLSSSQIVIKVVKLFMAVVVIRPDIVNFYLVHKVVVSIKPHQTQVISVKKIQIYSILTLYVRDNIFKSIGGGPWTFLPCNNSITISFYGKCLTFNINQRHNWTSSYLEIPNINYYELMRIIYVYLTLMFLNEVLKYSLMFDPAKILTIYE